MKVPIVVAFEFSDYLRIASVTCAVDVITHIEEVMTRSLFQPICVCHNNTPPNLCLS